MPSEKQLNDEFSARWRNKGATEQQIKTALQLAQKWAQKQVDWVAGDDKDLQQRIRPNIYKKAIDATAENWLQSILD